MPIIPPAIVLSTGLSRSRRKSTGKMAGRVEGVAVSFPSNEPWHRFTSDSKRGPARSRKVNFACFLVGLKKARGKVRNRRCDNCNFVRGRNRSKEIF